MNSQKYWILPMLVLTAALSLPGQKVIEAIVAVVNDDVITLSDFQQEHDVFTQTLKASVPEDQYEEQYQRMSEQLLENMITNTLLLQEAERMKLDVTEQLNMMIGRLKEENNIQSDAQLAQAFQQQGVDFEAWKQEQERKIKRDGVIFTEVGRNIVVDDNEVVNYYRQHPEEFTDPAEVTIKAVFFSSEGKVDEEIEGKREEVLGKLAAGQEFAEVAAAYTEGPGKESGGDLGTYKKGELAEQLQEAVDPLQPGEHSPWLKLANGWYLLHLVERKEDRMRPFEECRQPIEDRLFQEKNQVEMVGYLEKLKSRSYIKILIENPLESIRK
jgi:peptidyl-prolyl cis-trans isomerase SurA